MPCSANAAVAAPIASCGRHDDHPESAIERGAKLVVLEAAERAEKPHRRRHRPPPGIQARAEVIRQRARHVPRQPAASDVGQAMQVVPAGDDRRAGLQHGSRVDPRRGQQHLAQRGQRLVRGRGQRLVRGLVTERPPKADLVRLREIEVPLRDQAPDQ